ncbi:BH1953 [Halalkalibacterium halodurans C-125]|uniref:BH1953 protein n=1 Tax=Halalkalibacterium halodurans (strain ATCC BAA-125 / DSM 18197 / FERM 7344 / JCM 9153 / C-125) TaxID=272558 RepID=Q9KBH4_HALH5|nr:diacylglycerol kinase family protein [Halalkalibacterium halodurans]BAB05672.1 BH1953 [Halalkalibacterium halodurans C-125]
MYGLIVNKASGNGKGQRTWKKVEYELQIRNTPYLVRFTSGSGHATTIVKELLTEGVKTIIAVGGDGTINEVANGLVNHRVPLGIIPAGSGNDFARCLNIPMHYEKALHRIFENKQKKVDLLHLGQRHCLTVTGIGFDGKIAKTVNEAIYKNWFNQFGFGGLSYVLSMLEVLKDYRPTNIQITVDGKELFFSGVWLVAVANSPNYGGGIRICPEASYDDGLLNICVVHGMSKWQLLRLFPKAYKGKHVVMEQHVTLLTGKDVYVQSDTPVLVQSDGEPIMESPVRLQIKKGALSVV